MVKKLHLQRRKLTEPLAKKVPQEFHRGEEISSDTVVYENGKPVLGYFILPEDVCGEMRKLAESVKYHSTTRTQGLPTQSAVFGALPRNPARAHNFCRFSRDLHDQPQVARTIFEFSKVLSSFYEKHFPTEFEESMKIIQNEFHEDWRWMHGPFLTCNFNVNQAIPFHQDKGNIKVFSNVFILKRRIGGGELSVPEFGVSLKQQDRALTIFHGQEIVHGVFPIRKEAGKGPCYRASIVYYTMEQCKNCLSLKEELAFARTYSTDKASRPNKERKELIRKQMGRREAPARK